MVSPTRSRTSILAFALLALAACDQLKSKLGKGAPADGGATSDPAATAAGDAGAGATAAATPAAEPEPKNLGAVAKFGSENALENVEATTKRANVRVTTAIPSGGEVAVLPAGAVVKQVAEKSGFYRVTFADPKDPTSRLVGWVDKTAFIAPTSSPPSIGSAAAKAKKPITCAAGLVLAGEGEEATPACAKPCSDDKDCSGGECQMAFTFDPKTMKMHALPGARTMVCVGSAKPAAKVDPKAADAGAAAAVGYKVGDKVSVEWKGQWWPAKILAIGNGKYKVHYDGYGSEWDEFVGPSRVKKL